MLSDSILPLVSKVIKIQSPLGADVLIWEENRFQFPIDPNEPVWKSMARLSVAMSSGNQCHSRVWFAPQF